MADRVLVTGISGFLGGHVALALLNAGYAVRGSLRDLKRAEGVTAALRASTASGNVSGLDFVALDLSNDEGWREAMVGCRYLQHVASPFVVRMPADKNELIRPAVEGTRRALTAALAAGVERVVLTSSFAAIGYGHPRDRTAPFTEADWSKTEGAGVTAYTESKTRAELEAWSVMEAAGRRHDLVVINPTGILGPLLDDDPGTSNALLQRMLAGLPVVPRISFGIVDVRDVADLEVKAMTDPAVGGQRIIATAGPLTFKQIADALRPALPAAYAAKLPGVELPDWATRLLAPFVPELKSQLHLLGLTRTFDNRRGEALLGRPFRTPQEAAIATAQSLIARHLV